MSTPKPWENTETETLDFLFAMNVLHPLELKLYKKSVTNDEIYLGGIKLNIEDFDGMNLVRRIPPKVLKEKTFFN